MIDILKLRRMLEEGSAGYVSDMYPEVMTELLDDLERKTIALQHYADEAKWHKSFHRPEAPGPSLPIMFISENGWDTENLEPWAVARDALRGR